MRRPLTLLLLSMGACTRPVEADSLEVVAEPEPSARVLMVPDAQAAQSEPEAQPEPEARTEPGAKRPVLRLDLETWAEHGLCGVDVAASGLPAMSGRGAAVAYLQRTPPGGADAPLPSWLVIEDGETVQKFPLIEERESESCESRQTRSRRRIAKLNRILSAYRPLEELDVLGDTPAHVLIMEEEGGDPRERGVRALPGAERPVRATYSGGRFILRIPGVSVVHAQPQSWWRDDEFCSEVPNVRSVYGDRRTGQAVVEIDYISGGCLCGDGVYWKPLKLGDAAFDAIDARPTAVMGELPAAF